MTYRDRSLLASPTPAFAARRLVVLLLACVAVCAQLSVAHAGGLDAPTLHTARHAAMAGAVTASVDDPTAVFHNPAGLSHTRGVALLAASAWFITNLQTSPDYAHQNISTGSQHAPVPLLAGAYRVSERVALGLGVYPIGGVGGDFRYQNDVGIPTINQQQALLFEIAPAISLQLPERLSLGLTYRINMLTFRRVLGPASDPDKVDVDLFGANFTGVRIGAQWQATDAVDIGLVYRHRVDVTATADEGRLFGQTVSNVRGGLAVPGKVTLGARVHDASYAVSTELDYIFNSQFEQITIDADLPAQGSQLSAPFLFRWRDSMTLKLGGEARVADRWTLRAGYALDGTPINPRYPSTFSGPPTTAHFFSLGAGYRVGDHQINVAFAHRYAPTAMLSTQEIASDDECRFCAKAGQYWSSATALFVDVSTELDP